MISTCFRYCGGALAVVAALGGPALAAADFFPQSSQQYISAQELGDLDCYGLWHARNEIYARHDYKFLTAKAQAEFGSGGSTRNPKLNQIEQANIATIQKYEAQDGCS